jgi:hypothetical protein
LPGLLEGRTPRVLRAFTDRFGNWIRGTVTLADSDGAVVANRDLVANHGPGGLVAVDQNN